MCCQVPRISHCAAKCSQRIIMIPVSAHPTAINLQPEKAPPGIAARSALISVVIPTWNGARHLPVCFEALRRQTLPPYEIILVDNASTDDTRVLVARDYPEVRLLALPENRRFGGARNARNRALTRDFVALLNNDTEADPHWLENVADTFHA